MRLLNTKSLQLKDFLGTDRPPYAILSHTWGQEEVLFEDIQNVFREKALAKTGFLKVQGCCNKAVEDGFDWVWIDTCCIDKSSSAELSEAINSMFAWYQESTVCYAYLQDVFYLLPDASADSIVFDKYEAVKRRVKRELKSHAMGAQNIHTALFSHSARQKSPAPHTATNFTKSRWFTRGWTLQELIAPQSVEFYSAEWIQIGNKATLCGSISSITNIPPDVLRGKDLGICSVAQRISWASQRQTTRIEDIAYCLIGLFGVNMPLLYGEGERSFIRLQEEIMKLEEDYSILAWSLQYDCANSLTGLFASSPAAFSKSMPFELQPPILQPEWKSKEPADRGRSDPWDRRLKESTGASYSDLSNYNVLYEKNYKSLQPNFPHRSDTLERQKLNPNSPPELTSRGLRLTLPVKTADDPRLPLVAWIYCEYLGRLLCVLLQKVGSSQLYARHSAPWLITLDSTVLDDFALQEIYVQPTGLFDANDPDRHLEANSKVVATWGRIKIVTSHTSKDYTTLAVGVHPTRNWSLNEFFFAAEPAVIGALEFNCSNDAQGKAFVVLVGIHDKKAWCEVLPNLEHWGLEEIYSNKSEILASNQQHSGLLDMAVHRLDNDWCFSASIRKLPGSEKQVSYALHVHGCSLAEQDPWVSLYLRERHQISEY
jgi:hypothetical protein